MKEALENYAQLSYNADIAVALFFGGIMKVAKFQLAKDKT